MSLLLGNALRGGAPGMWWGLVVKRGVVAAALLIRLRRRMARPPAPLRLRETAAG